MVQIMNFLPLSPLTHLEERSNGYPLLEDVNSSGSAEVRLA